MATKKSAKRPSKSKLKPKSRLSGRWILTIVAIAIVGSVAVLTFAASPSKRLGPNNPVGNLSVGYAQEKAVSISRRPDGTITSVMQGRSAEIGSDGVLFCTPEDSLNTTSAQLSPAELTSIRNKVKSTQVDTLPDDITTGSTSRVGDYNSVSINNGGKVKHTRVYGKQLESANFQQAVSALQALCSKATQPVLEQLKPDFDATQVSFKNSTIINTIGGWITPKAYAASPPPMNELPKEEEVIFNDQNATRAQRGLPPLIRSACLDGASRTWDIAQASFKGIGHQAFNDRLNRVIANCGNINWSVIGENVGVGQDANGIYNNPNGMGYVTSFDHLSNIVSPLVKYTGIAEYSLVSEPQTEYSAVLFVGCNGACGGNIIDSATSN